MKKRGKGKTKKEDYEKGKSADCAQEIEDEEESDDYAQICRVFARGFRAKFVDEEGRLKRLLSELNTLLACAQFDPQVVAATSLLQSSGTGKSRSLVELSSLGIFVCYCSFQAESGCPLRTLLLADGLLSVTEKEHKAACCRAYLRSWLQCLGGYLKGEIVLASKGGASLSASASPYRSEVWTHEHVILERHQQSIILEKVATFWSAKPYCDASQLVSTWREVLPLLPSLDPPSGRVRIVFVFDEAGVIFSGRHEEVGLNMKRAFIGCELPALGIFVDTYLELPLFEPSFEMDSSYCIRSGKVVDLAPIWKVSNVDSLLNDVLDDWEGDDYRLGLARNKLYRYGRPLWASFMDGLMEEQQSNAKVVAAVEQFAARKLCGGVNNEQFSAIMAGKQLSCETGIAVLGARLVLDVQPHSRLAASLVANHMHFVINIPPNTTDLVTCEAWDPVIMAAACRLLQHEGFALDALGHLTKALEEGWVDEGKNGEIVACYILIRAADKVRRYGHHVMDLGCFLQVLCGDITEQEFKKIKNTCNEPQFIEQGEKLQRGLLNFKGFHAVFGYTPTVSNMLEFFTLEKAVICKVNQAKFDIILPVLLASSSGVYELKPERMSAVLIQVENINGKVKLWCEASTGMNPQGVICDWKGDQPFASVLMQLGATENSRAEFVPAQTRKKKARGEARAPSRIHMPFIVYGLNSKVYTFLSEKERSQLSHMIQCRRHPMMASDRVELARSIMPWSFTH